MRSCIWSRRWTQDQKLLSALLRAPELLEQAWSLDWSAAVPSLQRAINLYVVGRGPGLGIAQEAALKLKETCGLHAEAFSAAEVKHGPMALVGAGFPVLMLSQHDESRGGIEALADEFVARGAEVLLAGAEVSGASIAADDRQPSGHRADADDPELLPHGERARRRTRLRSGPAAASQQSHRDALMTLALINGRILASRGFVDERVVLIDDGRIRQVVPAKSGWHADDHVRPAGQLPAAGLHRHAGERRRRRAVQR